MFLLRSPSARRAATAVAIGAGYALAGHITYTWFHEPGLGPTFYPGAGLSLAALVLLDRGAWAWVLAAVGVAEWITDVAHGLPPSASLGYALANTVEPLVGASGLRAFLGRVDLARRRDLFCFGAWAVGFAPLVGGLIGNLAFRLGGGVARWPLFTLQWWIGDALGVLVVGGAVLGWSSAAAESRARLLSPGGVLLLGSPVVAAGAVFRGSGSVLPVFVALFLLVWVALRLGTPGVGLAGAGISCLLAAATVAGGVPFVVDGGLSAANWAYAKLGIGSAIFVLFLLAVEIREREAALAAADTAELRAAQATERLELLAREQDARRRAELLAQVSEILSAAADVEPLAVSVSTSVCEALGAHGAVVAVLEDDGWLRPMARTGAPGPPPGAEPPFPSERYPVVKEALDGLRPVFVGSAAERDARYPSMAGLARPQQAWANLPLVHHGRPVGFAAFSWTVPRSFPASDREFFEAVAHQLGGALARARLLEAERQARAAAELAQQRLTVVARASAVLAAAEGEEELLAGLTDVLVRHVCDRASVLLPGEHGAISEAYVLTAMAQDAPGVARRVQPTPSERDLADPRRAAWSTLTTTLEDDAEQLAGYLTDRGAEEATEGEPVPVGLLCAPVVARGLAIGVLAQWRFTGRPPFVAEDVELADDLGHRLGTALDTLRTTAEHRRIAQRLQAALLPGELPSLPGMELAARYVAADRHADVGGDFYDAIAVCPGRLVLAIGDVAGRGVDAAAVTGLARATLRAVAGQLGPAHALIRLNEVLLQRPDAGERFLTAACADLVVHPDGGGELHLGLGGHPQPMLLEASGKVRPLGTPGSLLGAFGDVEIPCGGYRLAPGDTLVFYTDGVIEARGATGLFGVDGLAAVLAGCAGRAADEVAGLLLDAVTRFATAAADDVALLVVRLVQEVPPSGG